MPQAHAAFEKPVPKKEEIKKEAPKPVSPPKPKAAPPARSAPVAPPPVKASGEETDFRLWVDKHKPKKVPELIGQPSLPNIYGPYTERIRTVYGSVSAMHRRYYRRDLLLTLTLTLI